MQQLPEDMAPRIFSFMDALLRYCGRVLCDFPQEEQAIPDDVFGVPKYVRSRKRRLNCGETESGMQQ